MHNHNLLVRGIIVDNDVPNTVERIRNVKVYRGARPKTPSRTRRRGRAHPECQGLPVERERRPQAEHVISISGQLIDTTPPGGLEYWAAAGRIIDRNPVQEHDRFYMAMLRNLGIEKGQPFNPDARQQAILEDAAVLGDAMARNVMFEGASRRNRCHRVPGHAVGLGVLRDAQPGEGALQPAR